MKSRDYITTTVICILLICLVSCASFKFRVTGDMEALKSSITELDYVSDFSYSLDGQPNSSYSKFSIIVVFENEDMMRLHDEDVLIEIFHFFSVNQQIMKDLDDIDALVYGIDYKYESSDDTLYYSSHERDAGSIDIWSVNNSHYIRIVEDGYYIYSSDLLEDGEFVAWDKGRQFGRQLVSSAIEKVDGLIGKCANIESGRPIFGGYRRVGRILH